MQTDENVVSRDQAEVVSQPLVGGQETAVTVHTRVHRAQLLETSPTSCGFGEGQEGADTSGRGEAPLL